MSAVETATSSETIARLDFDPEIACEVDWATPPVSCGLSAAGLVRCKVCGASTFCSQPCWDRSLAQMAGDPIFCMKCLATAPGLVDLFDFIPIKGKS